MKKFIISTLLFFSVSLSFAQALQIEWQYCFGGSDGDGGRSIVKTVNGYTLLCSSNSNDGDVSWNNGLIDFWLVHIDDSGIIQWEKDYGGSDIDRPSHLKAAPDGGYVLFGETWSNDGDVNGNHGGIDYWVVKTDSLGNLEWQKCLGSSLNNLPGDMEMDEAGNIYVIGASFGEDGDVTLEYGIYDIWMVKLDINGSIIWDKTLGGSWPDFGYSIQVTNDGGLLVSGLTQSVDYDVDCNDELGNQQAWVIKLDSNNTIEWTNCFGGTFSETAWCISPTQEDGYIFVGQTNSNDGDVSGFHGTPGSLDSRDIWVVKLDSLRTIEWQRCLGGYETESPKFIKITPEGNYLIGGLTNSNDGDVSGNHSLSGKIDQWLVKLDAEGEIIWQQCVGSYLNESIYDAIVVSENRYIILGSTASSIQDGDVNCDLKGGGDVWIYEVLDTTVGTAEIEMNESTISVFPNPGANEIYIGSGNNLVGFGFELVDLQGRIRIKKLISSNEESITTIGLEKGFYIFQFSNNNRVVQRGKWIKN